MSSLAEFNSSDGLPPLVMQKLNRDFKYLYSLIAGTDQPAAISVGSTPPTPRTDEVFWYDTTTGIVNTWAGNEEDGYSWTSLDPSIYIAIEAIAQEAYQIASATDQHFWTGDDGIHVTGPQTQDEWMEAVEDGFSDLSDDNPYHNILLNSIGILLRSALTTLVGITRRAIAFYDGTGDSAENIQASIGVEGAIIGKRSGAHIQILPASQDHPAARISFLSGNGLEAGYVEVDSEHKAVLCIQRAVVKDDLFFGESLWKFYKRSNNNFSIKWMGVV